MTALSLLSLLLLEGERRTSTEFIRIVQNKNTSRRTVRNVNMLYLNTSAEQTGVYEAGWSPPGKAPW